MSLVNNNYGSTTNENNINNDDIMDVVAVESQDQEQAQQQTVVISEENTPQETRIVKAVEIVRILGLFVSIFLGFFSFGVNNYYRYSAALFVFVMAGITGIESLLIGDMSARAKKWPTSSPYQKQSAMNNLSTCIAMIVCLAVNANDAALAVLMITVVSFLGLSGINHLFEVVKDKRDGKQISNIHFIRFGSSLVLVIAVAFIINGWNPFDRQ
jgi:hypothetical protein